MGSATKENQWGRKICPVVRLFLAISLMSDDGDQASLECTNSPMSQEHFEFWWKYVYEFSPSSKEWVWPFVCRVLALLSSMHPFKGSCASCIIPIYSRALSKLCTSCILPHFQDKYGYWGVRSSASGGPWCVWNTIEWADRKKRRSRMMPSPVIDRWTDDDDAVVVIIALGKLHGPTTTSFLKRDYQSWMCIWITFSTKSSMSI